MPSKRKQKHISEYSLLMQKLTVSPVRGQARRDPCYSVSDLKNKFSRKETEKYFSKLSKLDTYNKYMLGAKFPKEYRDIEVHQRTLIGNLDTEIWWTILALNEYTNQLNCFVVLSEEYQRLFLLGEYEKAIKILNNIEEKYGFSAWLFEKRIILYSKTEGMTKEKEYSHFLQENLPPMSSFLIYYYSQKLENELSYEQFNKNFTTFWLDYPPLFNYFTLKCNPLVNKINDLTGVLYYEAKSSIIDRYITLKRMLTILIEDPLPYSLSVEMLREHIRRMMKVFEDKELVALAFRADLIGCEVLGDSAKEYISALDLYTQGDYQKSYISCLSQMENYSFNIFSILELMVHSELRCKELPLVKVVMQETSIVFQVYLCIHSVLSKDNSMISSLNKLLKFSMELSSFAISSQILLFIKKNLPYIKQNISTYGIQLGKHNSFLLDIRDTKILKDYQEKYFLSWVKDKYGYSVTYQIYMGMDNSLKKRIPEYRYLKYIASKNNPDATNSERIEIYKNLIKNGHFLDKYEAIVQLVNLYFEMKEIELCLDTLVEGYLLNNNLAYSLPIRMVTEYIEKYHAFDFDENISTVILYDIYSKQISSDLDPQKAVRYDIFLESKGYARPSEIIQNYDSFSEDKINYFLQYICVIQILDSSIHFSSTKEIENERILICQFLVKKLPSFTKVLAKEIKEITEHSLISDHLLEIEQNKIYVNTDGIKVHLAAILNEYHLRYLDLLKNGDTFYRDQNYKLILVDGTIEIQFPKNDLIPLLLSALKEVRDCFVLSNEYGLNGYLSTNIRHGKLFNFLRSSLVSEKIITQKDNEEDTEYKDSEYWKSVYYDLDDESMQFLLKSLNKFSKNVDGIIYKLRNDYIQINTGGKDTKGLFNYYLNYNDAVKLYVNLRQDPTFDEFQDSFFDMLWKHTELNLESIRWKIENEISSNFQYIFTELITDLDSLKNKINLSQLRDVIAAESTKMQRKLETVVGWFTRPTVSDIVDFKFLLPISIAEEMVKNVHVNAGISINVEMNTQDYFDGFMLNGFVDILYTLFENAIKHSHAKKTNINVSISESSNKNYSYLVRVENPVSDSVNIELSQQKIDTIRELIRNHGFGPKVSSEGGTGFFKIAKALVYDTKIQNTYINMYFDKNTYFIVELYMLIPKK